MSAIVDRVADVALSEPPSDSVVTGLDGIASRQPSG
jgi:hypothetical protein